MVERGKLALGQYLEVTGDHPRQGEVGVVVHLNPLDGAQYPIHLYFTEPEEFGSHLGWFAEAELSET